ncbi:MAG: transcriptional regulator [Spirochaetes bacterium]|nr:transcriptional regulator [Spirochaetota bacterium]
MNVYESIMQGLAEAAGYQEGKTAARKTKLSVKPLGDFDNNDIKQIREQAGSSQTAFAGTLGGSVSTVEARESGKGA